MDNSDIKKEAKKRINIMKGHLNALAKMIEKDKSCTCLLDQSLAIQNSLKSLDTLILEKYLKFDLVKQFKNMKKVAIKSSTESNSAASPLREDFGSSFNSSHRRTQGIPEAIVKELLEIFKRKQNRATL